MNNFEKFFSLCVSIVLTQILTVNSQHPIPSISEQLQRIQQTQQAQKETEQNKMVKEAPESVPMQYNYRTPVNSGYSAYPAYGRDIYTPINSVALPQNKGNLFQVASGGDYFLTAQFSQIFYSFVGIVIIIAAIVFLIKYLSGYALDVSGLVQKIKDGGSAKGRAIDLNHLTNMVYTAMDAYGNSAAKDE